MPNNNTISSGQNSGRTAQPSRPQQTGAGQVAWDPFQYPENIRYSSRSRALATLCAIYAGKQYEGRADWWTGTVDQNGAGERQPLSKRKPCRIYKLAGAAVRQVVRFLLGEERWPSLNVKPTDGKGGEPAVSQDESEAIQQWLDNAVKLCGVKTHQRALATHTIASGTGLSLIYVKRGLFAFDTPRAQDCWPRFAGDDPSGEPRELVQCYEFDREVDDGTGRPKTARFLFRRQWLPGAVWTYEPVKVHGPHDRISWGEPTPTESGLSFLPAIWVRNAEAQSAGIDGTSLFAGSETDIEALDFTCSQRYRGIAYLGAPQPYETGVSDPQPKHAGPEEFWSYEGDKVNVGLIETSGKSYEVATKHVGDIRSELLEQWGVVLTNMTDTVGRVGTGNEMSGRFLEMAHAPLLALISEYRDTWWQNAMCPMFQMLLRICCEMDGQGLLIPGSDRVAKICQRFFTDIDGAPTWVGPIIEPTWGRYFSPGDAEIKSLVEAAAAAKDAKLIASDTATRAVAADFGVADIDLEIAKLEDEAAKAATEEAEREKKQIEGLHDLAHGPIRPGTGAGEDEAEGPGDRGRAAPDAEEKVQANQSASG